MDTDGRVYMWAVNSGRLVVRPGDYLLWKPYVRRSLVRVVKNTKPVAQTRKNFCGIATTTARRGQWVKVLVYGSGIW